MLGSCTKQSSVYSYRQTLDWVTWNVFEWSSNSVSKIIFGFVLSSVGVDRRLKNDPDVSQLDLRLKIRLDVPIFSIF